MNKYIENSKHTGDRECPKTKNELLNKFELNVRFGREFMSWIEEGIVNKELYLKQMSELCQEYKGYYFISPGGNYIVSLGSTWEGLRI